MLKILFLFSSLCFGAETPFLINGTAATVGKKLITVQDAYFYRALMRIAEGRADFLSQEEGAELRKTIQKMVFEEMVQEEIKALDFEGVSPSAARKQLNVAKGKNPKGFKKVLSRFGRTEAEAQARFFRALQVEKFLQRKVETLTPIITLKEVEQYYEQNKERFKDKDFQVLRPSIEILLKKERMREGLEEWIRFLRDKYGVTYHLAS